MKKYNYPFLSKKDWIKFPVRNIEEIKQAIEVKNRLKKLIEACNNLTAVLGLEPKISTESKKGMKKDLLEAAKLINPGDMSGMAPETISGLKELGVELEEMKVEEKPKKKKAEKKIKEEKEEEKVEEKPKKKKAEKGEGRKQ